jgi:L-iditol 2-dehydrogenase
LKNNINNQQFENIVFSNVGSIGVDMSIISTSNLDAFVRSLAITRRGGTISLFGVPPKNSDLKIDFNLIYSKELKIIPSYATTEIEIHQTIALIKNNIIDIEPLITHKFVLDDSQEALSHAHSGKDAMKIIITASD